MSGRQTPSRSRAWGATPTISVSAATPSVIPDARGPHRRGFSAVCWTDAGWSPARNTTRRSLPHEDAPSQKQPFPRVLLGLSREDQRRRRRGSRRGAADGARVEAEVTRQLAPDRHQYGRAAICKYGNIRVVTRTKSLHRRRTRFPLKVRTEAGVVAPARLDLRPQNSGE